MFPLVLVLCYGYGYGYILGPSPVPPIYLAGSFGPVLLPGWFETTSVRSTAVPQIVEGLTRPPRAWRDARFACPVHARHVSGGSRCCIMKPPLAVGYGGLGSRCACAPPRVSHPGSRSGVAALLAVLLRPSATRRTLTGPIRIPCSVVPPPRASSWGSKDPPASVALAPIRDSPATTAAVLDSSPTPLPRAATTLLQTRAGPDEYPTKQESMNGDPYVVFLCVSPCVGVCICVCVNVYRCSLSSHVCVSSPQTAEVPLPGPRLQSVPSCISIQQMIPSSVSIY